MKPIKDRTSNQASKWHEEQLKDLSELFHQYIHDLVIIHCGVRANGLGARCKHWLLEPVLYTLEGRKNFFRTGFSLAMGEFVGNFEVGRAAAFAGEIAWTCALLADDILDRSEERESHTCAHRIYGIPRTSAAIIIGLWTAFVALLTKPGVDRKVRLQMALLSISLLIRCAIAQIQLGRPITTMKAFSQYAREVNNSTHWSLLAPLLGFKGRKVIEVIRAYADAISVNAKMRNDLFDYCGGSSENVTLYRDFNAQLMTFPTFVLWQQELRQVDHAKIKVHFLKKSNISALTLKELMELFQTHRTFERCLKLMRNQVAQARNSVRMFDEMENPPKELKEMLIRWAQHQIDLAEWRVTSLQESQS